MLSTEVLPELARTKISIVARAFTDAGSSSGFAAIEVSLQLIIRRGLGVE